MIIDKEDEQTEGISSSFVHVQSEIEDMKFLDSSVSQSVIYSFCEKRQQKHTKQKKTTQHKRPKGIRSRLACSANYLHSYDHKSHYIYIDTNIDRHRRTMTTQIRIAFYMMKLTKLINFCVGLTIYNTTKIVSKRYRKCDSRKEREKGRTN